jgi:hypothetical protein
MSETFSKFFVEDKNSPQYTACVSVLLFNELQRCNLIDAEKTATKNCCWNKDFEVPNEYIPNTKLPAGAGHCLYLLYRYTSYYPSAPYRIKERWIRKICAAADCTNKSELNEVHRELLHWTSKYCHDYFPRKSTMVQDRL